MVKSRPAFAGMTRYALASGRGSPMLARGDITGFLINLDRSPDRLRASARQLEDLGLSWSRVSAFDGQVAHPALWSGIDRGRFESNVGRPITASEIALHLSHGAD